MNNRQLTKHIVPGDDPDVQLTIKVVDEPGPGGANHYYEILHVNSEYLIYDGFFQDIIFQNGPIKEVGVNGLTEASLLAILIDRMESFQMGGPYACEDNEKALYHLNCALDCLQERTRKRISRGVEGTNHR